MLDCFVSLETDNKLSVKLGTHNTSCKDNVFESLILPMCEAGTEFPFGKLIDVLMDVGVEEYNRGEQTMWSVAPVSRIHEDTCCKDEETE